MIIDIEKTKQTIVTFRGDYLGFTEIPGEWLIKIIGHKDGSRIPENDFLVYEFEDEWTLITVGDKYREQIENFINEHWYSVESLKKQYESLVGKESRVHWPVVSFYLFTTDKLLNKAPNVRQLHSHDMQLFLDFVNSCIDGEMEEVDMNFDDSTHKFFALEIEWKICSLGNYSIHEQTWIAHIWVVTPVKYAWNWYGKMLVNSIVDDILENNLIPQYRAKTKNVASLKIAESLGFKRVLESYTLSNK